MDIEEILDRYEQPTHRGALASPPALLGSATNPRCGDVVTMYVTVVEDRVVQVGFEGHGCTISQAAADLAAELSEGQEVAKLRELKLEWLVERLGRQTVRTRVDCATLALTALQSALADG